MSKQGQSAQASRLGRLLALVASVILITGCNSAESETEAIRAADANLVGNRGQVVTTIRVPRYTYIEVRSDGGNKWLAGPPVELEEGDIISWGDFALMQNFTSRELDRIFEELLFVAAVQVERE